VSVIVPYVVSKRVQSEAVQRYLDVGGVQASSWKAVGIGIVSLCVIVVFALVAVFVTGKLQ
jgi:hypothetical protein